jgi:hypothetical protein
MTSTTPAKATEVLARILREGYGTGAWHGPDLAAAVGDVTPATAFRRPAPGRHNVAEIALHHAFYVRSVIERLTGRTPDPFPVEGEDWFALDGKAGPKWPKVLETLAGYQRQLAKVIADLAAKRIESPLSEKEQFDLVLGITCHAVYHAGQMQLVKRLIAG